MIIFLFAKSIKKELMNKAIIIIFIGMALSVSSAAEFIKIDATSVYTLCRSSALDGGEKWRLHIATFDAAGGAAYNKDNCEIAKNLFQTQPGVTVKYWCERGYFSQARRDD